MKKLTFLFLLILCAGIAQAQDGGCGGVTSCDGDRWCQNCHYTAQYCYIIGCYACASECPKIEDGGLLTRRAKPPVHDTLTDLGRAVLAAAMPSMIRNPTASKVPINHPQIPASYWKQTIARAAKPQGCKAPVGVQILAVSMLRK